MRNPLAAWRSGVRWPLALIVLLAALVVAVGLCEAIGWPFLVGPVQRQLAKTLDRRIVFGADPAASGVRIGLLGSVRVQAASIEIGAPAWSSAPHMLLAREASLKLGYLDLWRAWRGGPLRIAALEAAEIDAALERMADGRASWQFAANKDKKVDAEATPLPTFGKLRVGDGHLAYDDAVLPARIDARFALSDGSGPAAGGVAAAASAASDAGIVVRAGGAASSASACA